MLIALPSLLARGHFVPNVQRSGFVLVYIFYMPSVCSGLTDWRGHTIYLSADNARRSVRQSAEEERA